jgi:hypothetical protein
LLDPGELRLLNTRKLRLLDARHLHHSRSRLRLQAILLQVPVVPSGQSLALLHGPLERRLQFVLGAGELRLWLLDAGPNGHVV